MPFASQPTRPRSLPAPTIPRAGARVAGSPALAAAEAARGITPTTRRSAGAVGASLLGAALLAVAPLGGALSAQPAAPATIPAFSVKDQFDRPLTREAVAGTPVIFIVAAREGADAAQRWSAALRGRARARGVRTVNVADLKGAPRLLRGVIRGSFPKDTAQAILMDFGGRLGRALRGKRPALVAVVYGADGRLRRAVELPTDGTDGAIRDGLLTAAERR